MIDSVFNYIVKWQQTLNITISDYFDLLDNGDNTIIISILFISFLYGLIHALGPGHGKMVIASYFIAKGSKISEALKVGFLTSIIHTLSALVITAFLYLFFQNALSSYFQTINTHMYKISAVFIILIACYLLYESLKDRHIKEKMKPLANKNILSVAFSIGLVPCPGVMTIVLYSMILGYISLGIFSAITMSIGMGLTISLFGVLASSIKKSKYSNYQAVINITTYVGISLLFILGFFLLL
ncbi:nickel/cobalt transporter [Arcobacter sp.]|uniref:nickel/cobalt transporter n=1 Tax=unclassified Arcobacter TaxID=2593671 RepID=UPI003B009B67